ncbi:MAG: hypothetical protein MAG451_00263 [Anaerolineales bacterium]|nr:hypothetical protein [Anaerolineales bacterium]
MKSIAESRVAVIIGAAGVVLLIIALVLALSTIFDTPSGRSVPGPEADLATETAAGGRSGGVNRGAPPATTQPAASGATTPAAPAPEPAMTEVYGAIAGHVSLEGRGNAMGITLLVNGVPQDVTDVAGAFRMTMPAGRYSVRARYPGHIAVEAPDVEVRNGEVASLPPATLAAGDTDEDEDIDLFDLVRCIVDLRGGALPAGYHADANGDGVADVRDFILAQRNYGTAGPAPWPD